jgi:phage tail-like protein
MNTTPTAGFLYANRDNAWLDFTLRGLGIVDGRLRLSALPAPTGPLPAAIADLPPPDGPAGLAVAPDGTVFATDPANATVLRLDGCDGEPAPVPCLGGAGEEPTRLRGPRGVLVHPGRRALIVADTGNHRLQVFDLMTRQLLDIWGEAGVGVPPGPSDQPGRFDTPSALAADPSGRVYVVDQGNHRVQQFTPGGDVVPGFWRTLAGEATLTEPVAVTVLAEPGGSSRIFVLDRARTALLVVDPAGHLLAEHALAVTGEPLGLAVTGEAVYVGENGPAGGRIACLRRDGSLVGSALGYPGPVAALTLDRRGGLLVHPGWPGPPVRLALDGAFVRDGIAWGGPFGGFSKLTKAWHRLAATMPALPRDAHARFFVHTTDDATAAPPVDEDGPDPFPASDWSPGPPDLGEYLIDRPDRTFAWIGLRLDGEGSASAAVDQIRLEFDHPTYLEHLPAIYRRDNGSGDVLPRYLSLVESLFTEVEGEIAGLARLADPAGAPTPFLAQLARWMALDVSPDWSEAELRDAVAEAYPGSVDRGSVAGLRAALRRFTGVDAWIEEPIAQASWWALAGGEASPDAERETSVLGVTTMLAAAQPQGAVVGSTAELDRSHLIGGDEYGTPLFETVAHRFTVRLYRGARYSEERVRSLTALLEREKPAHTEYVICRVDPRLQIGTQSRIGVDAIVGGELPAGRLDDGAALGDALVLGGEPAGRISERSQIGVTTLLGSASVQD